jgi:signal transduction histidine kinase
MQLKFFLSILIWVFATVSVHAQGYGVGTPMEAKKMVTDAIAFIKANGEEKALQECNKLNGKFQWRDLYVFAYDLQGVMKGHPNQRLIGRNLYNEPDSKGKYFRKEIVDLANTRGTGWVDYTYMNPMTRQEEDKIAYFQKEGNLIVCCGAYLP